MTYRALIPALLVVSLSACATQSSLDLYIKGQLQAEQGDLSAAMAP